MFEARVKNTFLHWDEPKLTRPRSRSADAPASGHEDACAQKLNQLLMEPQRRQELFSPLPECGKSRQAPSVEELRVLQRKIMEDGLSCSKRILSSSSVSTMASDEDGARRLAVASERQENRSKAGHMPKARSSGSVCSMCSDFYPDEGQIAPIMEEQVGPPIASAKDGTKVEFTHNQVPKNVDDLGFAGTYDFLYLPIDKGTLCNVGYAFVNFLEPQDAVRCSEVFHNYVFQRYRKARGKIAAVSIAHLQGLDANLQHYQLLGEE
eukprot:g6232.t1